MSIKDFLKEERGSMLDLLLIPIIVLSLLIAMLIMWTVLDGFPAGFIDDQYINAGKNVYVIFDKALIFIIVGLIIGAAALASQVRTHPVFLIPAIVFMAIAIFITAQIANVAYYTATSPQFSTAGNEFTTTMFIVDNLPKLVLIGGVIIALALYAKPQMGQSEPV